MESLVQIFDKVKNSYNNSQESWNKGLTVDYTITSTIKDNITYEWEITNTLMQDQVCLPCRLDTDEDNEMQIHKTLNLVKQMKYFQ